MTCTEHAAAAPGAAMKAKLCSARFQHVFSTASRTRPPAAASSRTSQEQHPTAYEQIRGYFTRWWQVLGSNQRRPTVLQAALRAFVTWSDDAGPGCFGRYLA